MENIKLYEHEANFLLPRIICFNEPIIPKIPLHWHDMLEFHYMLDSSMTLRCGNEIIEINRNECLIINGTELHENISTRPCCFLFILFPLYFIPKNNIVLKRKIRDPKITEIINNIVSVYYSDNKFKNIAMTGYASLLLDYLYNNHVYEEVNEAKYTVFSRNRTIVNQTIQYITKNYAQDIILSDISKEFHINHGTLSRIFKDFTTKTLKEYINETRIKKAQDFLISTDLSLSEISSLCGFNDANYFSRKFRQITKETPKQFRFKNK